MAWIGRNTFWPIRLLNRKNPLENRLSLVMNIRKAPPKRCFTFIYIVSLKVMKELRESSAA